MDAKGAKEEQIQTHLGEASCLLVKDLAWLNAENLSNNWFANVNSKKARLRSILQPGWRQLIRTKLLHGLNADC
jgi:hypothetical protein